VKRVLVASSFVIPAMIGGQALFQDAAQAQGLRTDWSGPTIGFFGTGASGNSAQTDSGFGATGATGSSGGVGGVGGAGGTAGGGPADGKYNLRGGLGGAGLGYNWQSGNWVYGIAGDMSFGDISGSSNSCGAVAGNPHECGTNLNWIGTVRGQLGYAVGSSGNWLPYVTGGLAFGNVNAFDALTPASGNATLAGWTAGVGVATMVIPQWVIKLEYLHIDLGSSNLFNVVPGVPENVSFKADLFRLGLSYQFNAPPPPAAPAKMWTKAN
jgi:outer membrane immunogenic protein